MAKRILKYTFILTFFICLMGSFTACTDKFAQTDFEPVEGMIPLQLKLGGAYPQVPLKAIDKTELTDDMIKFLPDSSTLRLIVLDKEPAGEGIKVSEVLEQFVYIIIMDNFGNPYPHPCKVDDQGKLIEGSISEIPYYMRVPASDTKYYCMAISPAKVLQQDGEYYKLAINNQETMLASNNYWNQTKYKEFPVSADVTQKATAELNPLMYTTARIRITIRNGEHVTELKPNAHVAELDRIPTNPNGIWYGGKYDEGQTEPDNVDGVANSHRMPVYNLTVGDTIVSQMGNNILYNRMYMHEAKSTSWMEGDNKKIEIVSETDILPMDARPTPMIIRLNLYVNETPMQFQFQTNKIFRAGHCYDFLATVSLQEGAIYVVSWQDTSWDYELDPA